MSEPRITDIVGINPPPQTFGQVAPLRLDSSRYPVLPRAVATLAQLYSGLNSLPPPLQDALSPRYWRAAGKLFGHLISFEDLVPYLRQASGWSTAGEGSDEAARAARYRALLEALVNPWVWQRFMEDPEGYGLPRYSEPGSGSGSTRRP